MQSAREHRFDIQVLRGIAVLFVLAFHAFPEIARGGFLGVDLFFVLSGYLVTRIILEGLERGTFTFASFYLRRARRLLPAAWTTLLATTVLGWLLMTSAQWHDYLRQLYGALAFVANVALLFEAGYFDSAAATKPLLHTWSLSLEEQYYLVLPVALLFTPRRWRLAMILAGLLASLGIAVIWTTLAGKANLAFYLLPARAWELLAGSLCAWLAIYRRPAVSALWKGLALAAIIAICALASDHTQPGWPAIAVCAATAVILLGRDGWLPANLVTRTTARIGDWSYSIYLIHWPLLCFAGLVYLGNPPLWLKCLVLLISVGLGWLQYRHVEQPLRRAEFWAKRGRAFAVPVVMLAAIAAVSLPMAIGGARGTGAELAHELRPNRGLAKDCGELGNRWQPAEVCRSGPAPRVAIWGDSFAMQLVPGLLADPAIANSLLQVTRSACAPIPKAAELRPGYSRIAMDNCVEFTDSVLVQLAAMDAVDVVVISSRFRLLTGDTPFLLGGRTDARPEELVAALEAAIRQLQASGKRVILVSPVPHATFNPAECEVLQREGLPNLSVKSCAFTLQDIHPQVRRVSELLDEVAQRTGATFVRLDKAVCPEGVCRTAIEGKLVFRDRSHLSVEGARRLVPHSGLIEAIGPLPDRR
ncbi:acyltransferase family protein [Novosphingobium sp.]|uniref:acyltransferase family protein n=1 Tax=Novosphingobium sp. TaxID=1874826 RepID=UPI00286D886F|nr:acyltransferase family protein [Novosphingobium sp.]